MTFLSKTNKIDCPKIVILSLACTGAIKIKHRRTNYIQMFDLGPKLDQDLARLGLEEVPKITYFQGPK